MGKTVVFSWIYPLDLSNGGIERVTQRLMDGLSERGYQCMFLLHDIENGRFIHLGQDVGELGAFLNRHDVHTLINQNGYSSDLSTALEQSCWSGKYIVCHHNEPQYLRKLYDLAGVISEIFRSTAPIRMRLTWLARFLTYPLWREWSDRKIGETQRLNYERCDHYVLLSPAFLQSLTAVIRQQKIPKAIAIPNPLSFDINPDDAETFMKKKEVLIVARLHDREKRISTALRVWQIIEKSDHDGWTLKVIGGGPDSARLQKITRKLGLKRVSFLGRKDPLPNFKSAAIFLMTSRVEGWGLTLTEAMQTKTVPVAFDAYASVQDIMDHSENGMIIRNGDVRTFARQTQRLMENVELRETLATNALHSCQKYRLDAVLDRWEAVL